MSADGTISLDAESAAIHWAVDHGARVINLSLGGLRDPGEPSDDTYSALEAAAVAYAVSKGVVVVAAVGNSDQAPTTPWNYASYPAALPHVIGVGALAQDGSVPLFSDRDPVFVDLAAPGQGVLSTFPRALTAARPACVDQGYSDCAGDEYSPAARAPRSPRRRSRRPRRSCSRPTRRSRPIRSRRCSSARRWT